MLSVVNNHRIDMLQSRLEFLITKFTLSQAEKTTLGGSLRTLAIANRTVTSLTVLALWIAQISATLLAHRAGPLSTMSGVGVPAASEAQIFHSGRTVGRAHAAADTVPVCRAWNVPLIVPLFGMFFIRLWTTLVRSAISFFFVAKFIILVIFHFYPWVRSTACLRTTTKDTAENVTASRGFGTTLTTYTRHE